MRGVYTAGITIPGLASAKTLLLLQPPANMVVEILSVAINNLNSETSEQLAAEVSFVNVTGSPTGDSVTPTKHEIGDAAAGSTVTGDLDAEPTSYLNPIDKQGFNVLSGYRYDPIPEERPIVKAGSLIGLRLLTAPTAFDAYAQIVYREIG